MTSFITTMFVSSKSTCPPSPSSRQQLMSSFPSPPRPLESVVTLVESSFSTNLPQLAASATNVDLFSESSFHKLTPRTSRSSYASPVRSHLHAALASPRNSRRPRCEGNMAEDNMDSNSRTSRTPFRPQKAGKGTTNWQLKQFAEATLGSGSLRKAVKLPEGEDKDEWLAVNVVDFYNQINLLYGSITEFCSPQSCPEMKATDEFEYLWQDEDVYRKPTKMPAPEYVEHLMSWVQATVDNESIFPSRIGVPFPKSFRPRLQQIFKRLYRVYAHIYCHHYPIIVNLGLEPHLNTSFKHYVLFIEEFGLAAGQRDFWGPMGELVENMLKAD